MDVNYQIARKIRTLSKQRKYPLKSLAEDVGISEQGLHGMMKKGTMQVSTLFAISEKLKVPITFFVCDGVTDKKEVDEEIIDAFAQLLKNKLK